MWQNIKTTNKWIKSNNFRSCCLESVSISLFTKSYFLQYDITSSIVQLLNSMCVSRVPRMSSWMLCNSRRCFYKSRCSFFINQEVRRQLLINTIFEGDWTLIIPLLSRTSPAKYVDILQDILQGILQALHPKSVDSIVHTAAKWQQNLWKTPQCLGRRTCWQPLLVFSRPKKLALIKSCRLTSWFIKKQHLDL